MHSKRKQRTIFSFFGPPGAGKGTLATHCHSELGFTVLSTGDLCRKEIARGSVLGRQFEEQLNQGKLISDELIAEMIKKQLLEKVESYSTSIILDGFPRTARQASYFLHMIKMQFPEVQFKVIFFDIPADEVMRRLSNRLVCSNQDCQAVYSLISLAPQKEGLCDKCGKALIKRHDDEIDVIRKRLDLYPSYEKELLDYYKSVNQPVELLTINAKSAAKVFECFSNFLGQETRACCEHP